MKLSVKGKGRALHVCMGNSLLRGEPPGEGPLQTLRVLSCLRENRAPTLDKEVGGNFTQLRMRGSIHCAVEQGPMGSN